MVDVGPEDYTVSTGTKIGAAVAGFFFFYALALTLVALVAGGSAALGAIVPSAIVVVAIVAVVVFRLVRGLRDKDPRLGGTARWFALGFVAAMVVFGSCIVAIAGGAAEVRG